MNAGKRCIAKPIIYGPKARADILFLPEPGAVRQLAYLRPRGASKAVPCVIPEVYDDPGYACYATCSQGSLPGFELFETCAACPRYRQAAGTHYDEVRSLRQGLDTAMYLTGQLTLDPERVPRGGAEVLCSDPGTLQYFLMD